MPKIMKCVICYNREIEITNVKEEFAIDDDIIFVSINIPVCKTCGERYYDRKNMRYLQEIRDKLGKEELELKEIGKVLVYN
jgi:YgiT-type zinc finger domain-containing protein